MAAGTWVPLATKAPVNIGVMLLLPDGTVLCSAASDTSAGWYRLTPDTNGSYINGSWSTNHPSNYPHNLFAADVVPDGRVFVGGGEHGIGITNAEIYDPVADHWTVINPPTSLFDPTQTNKFSDMISAVISNGSVLMAPIHPLSPGGTLIYNAKSNLWSDGPILANGENNQGECSWAKLADGSILSIDTCRQMSQRYIPWLNQWVNDGHVPVSVWNTNRSGCEIGPAVTLPNGHVFFAGGNGNNVLYTPSGDASPGSWTSGPVTPDNFQSADAPGAMMVNGNVLLAMATNCFNGGCDPPWAFFVYDYSVGTTGSFTQVSAPTTGLPGGLVIPWMLDLPDGKVLLSFGNDQLNVYEPGGTPLPAGKPTITSISANPDGSFHLVGTGLNGISEGSFEGDDGQMASDYPLVRLINNTSGAVYYARTYNWSSTGILTGTTPESTEFRVPTSLPPGAYSLVVVANGIASDPEAFDGPVWVDFNTAIHPGNGTFATPYYTLALGISAVSAGGTIFVKPGSSSETPTITKAMNIVAVGGSATVGN